MKLRDILPWSKKGLQVAPKEQPPADNWNRADFRRGGLQGRKRSRLIAQHKARVVAGVDDTKEQKWEGMKRRSFLGADGHPRLYLTHSIGWLPRAARRTARSSGKMKREMARARARGEFDA